MMKSAEASVSFSPLTQVYQQSFNFPREENTTDNGDIPSALGTSTSGAKSTALMTTTSPNYGAVNRRRLNSIVPASAARRSVDPLLAQAQMNNAMRKFAGTSISLSPPTPPELAAGLRSNESDTAAMDIVSPTRGRSGERLTFGSSLQQVQEHDGGHDEFSPGDPDDLSDGRVNWKVEQRLGAIEKKQERIEKLLEQLVDRLNVTDSR